MKNFLLYNYDINIDNLTKISESIMSFYIDYDKYYLVNIQRNKEDIMLISDYLKNHKTKYHKIIFNKNNQIISTDQDKKEYVLIKINGAENIEVDLREIIGNFTEINTNALSILDRSNWAKLWEEKIDYLEYQISELGSNHPSVIDSFSYYIGLAENAIEYFNMIVLNNVQKVLSQKRIEYPNFSVDFYNPLNLIVDYRVRDVAEYIKSKFFSKDTNMDEIIHILSNNYFSTSENNLLFARLLYPTYYFDKVTRILEKEEDDDILLDYLTRIDEYELFLKKVLETLSQNCEMIKIDWIIKKSEK